MYAEDGKRFRIKIEIDADHLQISNVSEPIPVGHRGTLHIDDLELQPELPRDYEAIAAKASLISKR